MTTIYLIRHAEAEGNLYRRAQGHWDGRLTPRGLLQTDALAERFKGVHLDAVYSSDLSRTRQTADALLRGRSLELLTTERLREVCMGVWEGQPWGNIAYSYPRELEYFNNDPARWSVPGCESFAHVEKRMTAVLSDIAKEHDGQTVGVLSHGMAIKTFLMGVTGVPSDRAGAMSHGDNTSVSLVEYEEGAFRVLYASDASHLPPELSTFSRQKWWRDTSKEDPTSLRFTPLVTERREELEFYLGCYADSWRAAHGSTEGFVPGVYAGAARSHRKEDPNCLLKIYSGSRPAGVIELDSRRGADRGSGWITLFYLTPELRGRGYGIQLLGCAMAYYAAKGREKLMLHAAVTNEHAVGFYKHFGFTVAAVEPGVASDQYLMERPL